MEREERDRRGETQDHHGQRPLHSFPLSLNSFCPPDSKTNGRERDRAIHREMAGFVLNRGLRGEEYGAYTHTHTRHVVPDTHIHTELQHQVVGVCECRHIPTHPSMPFGPGSERRSLIPYLRVSCTLPAPPQSISESHTSVWRCTLIL